MQNKFKEKYYFIHSEAISLYVKKQNALCFIVSNIGPAKIPGPNIFVQENGLVTKKQISFPDKKYCKPAVPKLRQHTRKAFSKNA